PFPHAPALQQLKEHFISLGALHAQSLTPPLAISDQWLRLRAERVVTRRLPSLLQTEVDPCLARAFACGGYVEGYSCEYRAMNTVPHLRLSSHLWAVGYRDPQGREFLDAHESDDCTLFVDIRDIPNAPFQPEWSRKQLRERFGRRYRHLRYLGNINYRKPLEPIIFRDEEAGLSTAEGWLLAGWSMVFICACANRESCHGTLAVGLMQDRLQAEERVQCHKGV